MNSILNEYGVLGSLLIDPSLFPEAAELPDDMFSSVPLQEIFRAMRHQYEESGSFDALTVRVEAGRNCTDVTDKLIAGLMDTTPTTANLDVYLAAVKEAALARSLRKIGEELMTAEHDPTDALGRAQEALQRLAEENTRGDSQTLTAVLMQLGYRVSEQVGGRVPCVASGLLRFDKLLGGGFINGGLHVIGARPAVGKSALALQIALNAARNGVKVLYLSLEMSAEDCSARLVGNIGGLSSARLMFGGRLTDNEYTRFAEGTTALSALPLVFNKRTGKGDVIIRFNPTDGTFIQRLYNAFDTLDKKQEKYADEVQKCGDRVEIFNIADRRDKEMREIIDGLFEEPVCDSIFGSMNLYALADGLNVWVNFLLALMDETDSAFAREQKATNPRIQKYTAKYRR